MRLRGFGGHSPNAKGGLFSGAIVPTILGALALMTSLFSTIIFFVNICLCCCVNTKKMEEKRCKIFCGLLTFFVLGRKGAARLKARLDRHALAHGLLDGAAEHAGEPGKLRVVEDPLGPVGRPGRVRLRVPGHDKLLGRDQRFPGRVGRNFVGQPQ